MLPPYKKSNNNINYGIKTGFNEAFIIDNDTKQALCSADPKSAEIIKPILRGRNIKAYEHHWAGWWLINSHNGDKNNEAINIDDYPAVKNHLDQYYPQLEKRCDQGRTPYNLRNCAYLAEFTKEKIVYREISENLNATYIKQVTNNFFVNNKLYIITGEHLKFLLAFLNSKVINRLLNTANLTGGKGVDYLNQIPIPKISKSDQQPFINLANKILIAKKANQDSSDLEAKIDKLVYQIYDLTDDEINLISDSLS